MEALWTPLLISLAPAVGVLAGGILGRRLQLTPIQLSLTLHVGAGVVLGVVGVELMPRFAAGRPWVVLPLFLAGGLVYVGTTVLAEKLGERVAARGGIPGGPATLALTIGVGFDMLTDGIMIAAGQQIGGGLGLLLGAGLLIADSPEAFSTVAAVKAAGWSPRWLRAVLYGMPLLVLLGAPLGVLLLSGQSQLVEEALLAFTAGMLVLVVVEGLVPEAHGLTRRDAALAASLFLSGFTAFALLSAVMGG
jgi:hypothetical protein